LLLFTIAAPLNQYKVPSLIPVLTYTLGLSMSGAGLLMSVYAIAGLALAVPAGIIVEKTGSRAAGLLAGGSIAAGAVLGALSRTTGVLLFGRVIEGAGTSLMAVLAPAIIVQWFMPRRRGAPMGVWASWVPAGATIMSNVAPPLAAKWGWRSVWWAGAAYALVVTALYLTIVRPAPAGAVVAAVSRTHTKQVLRNRQLWLLAAAWGAFNAAVIGRATYLPTYLSDVRGLPLSQAALIASTTTMVAIFTGPLGGLLADRIGSHRKPYLSGLAMAVVLLPLAGALRIRWLIVLVIVEGIVLALAPANIFAAAMEAAGDRQRGGMAMAMIIVGQNLGILLGPLAFGATVEWAGWPGAFASVGAMAAIGLLAGWLARAD
jgi:MFS family permease